MRALAILAFLFVILPLIVFAIGQFGLLAGRPPTEPGLKDGKLRPPSRVRATTSLPSTG